MSTTGSDSSSGKTGNPLRSIAKALAIARKGDTVKVKQGTYEKSNWVYGRLIER